MRPKIEPDSDSTKPAPPIGATQSYFVEISWNEAAASAANATPTFTLGTSSQIITAGTVTGQTALSSFGGGQPWTGPAVSGCDLLGPGAGNTCIIINQTAPGPDDVADPAMPWLGQRRITAGDGSVEI